MTRERYQPNYLTPESEKAETDFHSILKRCQEAGFDVQEVDLNINPAQIVTILEKLQPERLRLVREKLRDKGIRLEELNQKELLDKALGIDFMFKFKDKIFTVDVASGNSNTILNKGKKIRSLQTVYEKLGIAKAIVIGIRDNINDDLLIDFLFKLENEIRENPKNFYLEFRYNKPLIH